MDASSVNFIRRLDKIQHDRAEHMGMSSDHWTSGYEAGSGGQKPPVTSNGAQDRIEILMKT